MNRDQLDAFPEIKMIRDRLVAERQLQLVLVRNVDFLDQVRAIGDTENIIDCMRCKASARV